MTAPSAVPAPRWTTYVRLDQLRPAVRNPKKHDLPSLVESVQRHGFTNPILVCGRTERIAGGHGRMAALVHMKQHGDPMPAGLVMDDDAEWCVPVTRGWASKNDSELEQYIILDNRLTEAGGWDDKVLVEMMHDLNSSDPDLFDGLGWTSDELDDLFRKVDPERLDKDPDDLDIRMPGEQDESAGTGLAREVECPNCYHQFIPKRDG